jgi:hypothetical protein
MSDTAQTAQQAGRTAREHGSQVADSAREQAGRVRDEATSQARVLLHESGGQLRDRADSQARDMASTLSNLSDELRSMADGSNNPDGALTHLAHRGSQQLATVSQRLDSGGIDAAMDDLRRFGRRRPVLFLGACLAAGVVLGRTLRNADTSALTDAAKSEGGNGSSESDGRGSEAQRSAGQGAVASGPATSLPPASGGFTDPATLGAAPSTAEGSM